MSVDSITQQTSEKIITLLSGGFILSIGDHHFLESTFGISGADDFIEMIQSDNSDVDVLLEYVISPDEAMQSQIEPYLSETQISHDRISTIVKYLFMSPRSTPIRYMDSTKPVSVIIPGSILERFVTKLKLSSNPPVEVVKGITKLSDKNSINACVKLRNAAIPFTPPLCQFINSFFSRESDFQDRFISLLTFALSVIEGNATQLVSTSPPDIATVFQNEKNRHQKTLDALTEAEKQFKGAAVETMMMQGNRLPPVSRDAVKLKIEMAEIILITVFGIFDTTRTKPTERDFGVFSDTNDIQALIRMLS